MKLLLSSLLVLLASGFTLDKQYVLSDEATYKSIGVEYLEYVEKDASLDDEQKEDRRGNVRSWKRRIEEEKSRRGLSE